jgi:hypothetical protein
VGAAVILAGCGLGAGATPGAVTLTVTREFGAAPVPATGLLQVHGQETAMSLLTRNYTVATAYSGGFVESIDGHGGGQVDGEPTDWFYYVNGSEAPKGAAETKVQSGDAVWWDLHDWSQAEHTPAVVGSFPEPFLAGVEGKRLPVRVECAEPQGQACHTVTARLDAMGIPVGFAGLGPGGEDLDTLRVAVGPWSAVKVIPAADVLQQGPGASGVYARMAADGSSLEMLNARGAVTHTLTAGAGLVAAVRYSGQVPLWLITGTDPAGVKLAADDLDEATLHDHFAVAAEPTGTTVALPQAG